MRVHPGCPSLGTSSRPSMTGSSLLRSQPKCHHFRKAFPDHPLPPWFHFQSHFIILICFNFFLYKSRLIDTESKLVVTSCRGRVNIWVGKKEGQTLGCKVGYNDILHNRGNTANICNNCKWSITFKTYIYFFPHSIYHCLGKNYSHILFDHRVISLLSLFYLTALGKAFTPWDLFFLVIT